MREGGSNRSLQLVEWGLGLVIAGVMLSAALPAVRTVEESPVARETVQQIQELMVLARDEAVRTGRQHVVFFDAELLGGPGVDAGGNRVMAVLARDIGRDESIISLETIASVNYPPGDLVGWGSRNARVPAPGDLASDIAGSTSFWQPDGRDRANWLSFRSDGSPRAMNGESWIVGMPGSGAGAVYLRGPHRDYAVVVSPSGAIEQHRWTRGDDAWERGAIR